MSRPPKMSKAEVKRLADKAEGKIPPHRESRGHPTDYRPEYVEQARKLCLLGATDMEVADFFEIAVRTLYRWKNEYPEFCQALTNAKEIADDRVERSLYQRAIGYTFDAVKIMAVAGEVQKVAYREHVPPDPTSMIFWLKNRRKAAWRDRHEHEVGNVGDFDRMSDDELRDYIARSVTQAGDGVSESGAAPAPGLAPGTRRPH